MSFQILKGDVDAPLQPLLEPGRVVAVIGYGNQGAAHALNLRDSGVSVRIGAREGRGANAARREGFSVASIASAVATADLIVLALPDEVQPDVIRDEVVASLKPGATLGFVHGFAVHFRLLPDLPQSVGVVMVAPKGPGQTLRNRFTNKQGIPCLLAVDRDSAAGDSRTLALAWANGIGCARAGIIETTFRDEAETDLFGEQAVLCGGMTALVLAGFETLVAAGYPPELAYLECCHELKQVADLMHERGIAGMMGAISNTAEFGAHKAMPIVVDQAVRTRLQAMLRSIQDGSFAQALRDDHALGFPWFGSQRRKLADHPIEDAGKAVRALMPWLVSDHPKPAEKP